MIIKKLMLNQKKMINLSKNKFKLTLPKKLNQYNRNKIVKKDNHLLKMIKSKSSFKTKPFKLTFSL